MSEQASALEMIPYHRRSGAKQRRVVCAAHRHPFNGTVAVGPRHFHPLIRSQIAAFAGTDESEHQAWRISDQGFIDQWGTFMGRREAFIVAQAAGQILYGPHLSGGELDSSDLY